jgi:hypothetical protein
VGDFQNHPQKGETTMSNEKKKGRRAYLNDFRKNAAGEYLYTGDHYQFVPEGKTRRRFLAEQWLFCGGLLIASVLSGCIPATGMANCPYVILPYVVGFVSAVSLCWGLGRLTAGGDPLRAYVYEASVQAIPQRAMLTAVFAGLAALGEGVYLLLHGSANKTWDSFLFVGLEILVCLLALLARQGVKKQNWKKK